MSGANVIAWFTQIWPTAQKRFAVMGEYRAAAQSRFMLADIALRGSVYRKLPDDPHQMAIAEGRRRLALEIIELTGTDPQELFALIERKPKGDIR